MEQETGGEPLSPRMPIFRSLGIVPEAEISPREERETAEGRVTRVREREPAKTGLPLLWDEYEARDRASRKKYGGLIPRGPVELPVWWLFLALVTAFCFGVMVAAIGRL